MAKFFGKVGFVKTVETAQSVWSPQSEEREYYGDFIRKSRRVQKSNESTNDNISLGNDISIVADSYANENIYAMRYVEFDGNKWTIDSAELEYPRIRLSIGGIYHA